MEAAYKSQLDQIANELANHYALATDKKKAVAYLKIAGDRANARGSMAEAEGHYRRANELMVDLPESDERDRLQLPFLMDWAKTLQAVRGYAHAETHRVLALAQVLAEELGETNHLTTLLNRMSASAFVLGKMAAAQNLAEREVEAAQVSGDRGLLCAAHRRLGENLLFNGSVVEACKHLDVACSYFTETDAQKLSSVGAIAPASVAAVAHMVLGFPERARGLIERALDGAPRRRDLFELGFVHMYACISFKQSRDLAAMNDHVAALEKVADSVPLFRAQADFYGGWALFMRGRIEEGKERLRRSLDDFKSNGPGLFRWMVLETEADFCVGGRRIKDALLFLEQTLADGEEVLWRKPVVLTLRADLLALAGADPPEIEAMYRDAIGDARTRGTRLFELQGTTHFVRWLATRGRRDEARTMLAQIYDWFTEGFDTKDLKEAKALLEELQSEQARPAARSTT
jgi:tetratricopeptide (TPR) repeat protein